MRNQNDEDDVDDNDDKKTPSPTTSRRRGGSKKDESNKGNAAAKQKAGGAASMSVEQMEKGISNPELARLASKLAAWVHALDRRVLAYFKMFALVFALAVYAYVLADQRQAGASFDMARSIRDAVVPSTREFTSSMAAQTWIEQTVSSSWVDDPCGNGVCDAALGREVPGFGGEGSDAHGCVADCGRVADIPGAGRTLLLHIKSNIADSAAATGVSATTAELSADVEWNVCLSEDRRTCYYASSQKLGILGSGNEVVTLHNLPTDSAWTMHVMGDWFHAVSWELKNKNDVAESATRAKKEVASTCGASRYLQKEQVALESSAALLASTFDNALETLATFEANSTAIDLSANLTSGILTQAEHDARLQAAIDKKNSTLTSLSELRKVCAMNQTLAGCTDLVRQAGDAVPVAESAARALLSEAKQYAQDEALSCAQGFLKELREKMDYLLALEISLAVGPYASDVEKASLQTLLNDQIAKLNIQSKYTSALQPASVASLPKATLESTVLARIAEVKYALQAQPKEISGIVPAPTIALLAGASTAYQTFAIGRRASAYAGSCQNRTNTIRYPDIAKCTLVCECPATCTATQFCGCETCAVDPPPPPATTTTTTATTTNATTVAASDAASSKRRRHLSQASPIAQTLENLESNQGTILAEARQIERNVAMLESTIKSSAGANLDDMITASLSSLDTELRHMSAELERAMFGRASTIQLSTPRAISPSLTRARLNAFAQRMTSKPSEINNALAAKIADVDKAVAEGVIDAASADKLRDQAREDALKLEKAAIIANMPCSVLGRRLNIPSGRSAAGASAVRVRTLGGDVNRIVGGLLVQTVREREGSCPKSRFDSLNGQVSCGDGLTNAPYGSDIPSSSASSFTDDEVRKFIQYNCSKIGQSSSQRHVTARATYPLNRTAFTDPVEYCSEMYDARGMPFAFYSPVKRLAAFRDRGYPLYFDIDMSSSEAQSLAAFAKNGGFVDDSLLHMDARIAVWNSELRRFGYVKLRFHRGDSGLIRVEPTIRSAKMSAYETTSDYVRLAFEITLISLAVLDMGITTYGLITSPAYRRSLSSKIDVISILFFLGVIAFWYFIAFGVTDDFSVNLRYDVYAIPYGPPSSPVLPGNSQTSLHALADKMSDLDRICDLLTYYFVLAGACLFLLLCRTLTSMTFQPRLGAFVNTVHYAGADLVNFLCVFLMCLIAYALIGHVVFGDLVDSLSTVPKALVALVEVVLGDTKFNAELMRETDYNDYLHANAILYFWSYAMLQLGLSFGFVIAIFINSHDSERQRLVQEYGTDGEPGVLREIGLLVKSLVDSDGGMRTLRRFVRSIGGDDAKYSARDAYRRAGQTPVESKVLTTPSGTLLFQMIRNDSIDFLCTYLNYSHDVLNFTHTTRFSQMSLHSANLRMPSTRWQKVRISTQRWPLAASWPASVFAQNPCAIELIRQPPQASRCSMWRRKRKRVKA